MLKKLLLIFVLFFVFTNFSYAEDEWIISGLQQSDNEAINNDKWIIDIEKENLDNLNEKLWDAEKKINNLDIATTERKVAEENLNKLKENSTSTEAEIKIAEENFNTKNNEYSKALIEKTKYFNEKWISESDIEKRNEQEKKYYEALATYWNEQQQYLWSKSLTSIAEKEYNEALKNDPDCISDACNKAKTSLNTAVENEKEKKETYDNSKSAETDVTSRWFEIKVDNISPWMKINWGSTEQNVNKALWTIIQTLMIALWSLSLIIMTVWAWYIILHNWQDELLSKWKSIFMSWIYALIVALSAYYLVAIVRFVLYSTTGK